VNTKPTNAQRGLAFREAILTGITTEDVTAIVKVLVERGKAGDLGAVRLLLDRLVPPGDVPKWEDEGVTGHADLLTDFIR
jgi:hypothetical protein